VCTELSDTLHVYTDQTAASVEHRWRAGTRPSGRFVPAAAAGQAEPAAAAGHVQRAVLCSAAPPTFRPMTLDDVIVRGFLDPRHAAWSPPRWPGCWCDEAGHAGVGHLRAGELGVGLYISFARRRTRPLVRPSRPCTASRSNHQPHLQRLLQRHRLPGGDRHRTAFARC